MILKTIRKAAKVVLPAGSRRRIAAGRAKSLVLHGAWGPSYGYKVWLNKYERQTLAPVLKNQQIKFSIIVPAYNTPNKYSKPLINSVINQSYLNWQLIIADGSTDEKISKNIQQLCKHDSRITYIKINENLGISGNTNKAIPNVKGEFVAFLDHDDVLPEWSLNEVAAAIKQYPKADILYSDEDRLTDDGKKRMSPFLKPGWSPDLFLSANYLAHFCVMRSRFFEKLGGLRSEFDGSQDYDLLLRALDTKPVIVHVPKILYHMRMARGSTARAIGEKNYAHENGKKALEDYFQRNKLDARVLSIKERPTNYRIKYSSNNVKASIIIPFKDKSDLLKNCLESLEKTNYKNYEILLISNKSSEKKTGRFLKSLKNKKEIRIFNYDKEFNYSAINNFGRTKAKGEVLVFLNNDTKVIEPDWLDELVSNALRPEIGSVGCLLLYPDKTIQHAGVVLGMTGLAGHIFRKMHLGSLTPFWLPDWPRNYLAVTGACVAIESKKFDEIGGFNESFIIAGSDVVLGLKLFEKGYRNLYWPFAKLIHYESKSVGSYLNAPISDYKYSQELYKPYLNYGDPYYNPNLSLESEPPIMRTNYE